MLTIIVSCVWQAESKNLVDRLHASNAEWVDLVRRLVLQHASYVSLANLHNQVALQSVNFVLWANGNNLPDRLFA